MSDEADKSDGYSAPLIDAAVKQAQNASGMIPKGAPGECYECGEWMPRVVDGLCPPCIDKIDRARARFGK